MLYPDGEVVDTVTVGQVEAVEAVVPTVNIPGEDQQAGAVTLTGTGLPGASLII